MHDLVPTVDFTQAVADASGQLGKRSGRIYANDAKRFAEWITANGLTVGALTRSHLIAYRSYLDGTYAKATAARMLSVARRILNEQLIAGNLAANPAKEVRAFRSTMRAHTFRSTRTRRNTFSPPLIQAHP